jgi:hypothetical protein
MTRHNKFSFNTLGNLAIMPFYSFTPEIFNHPRNVRQGEGN